MDFEHLHTAWEEERDKKLAALTWQGPEGKVGLKQVNATNCVWTIQGLEDHSEGTSLGIVIAYVDDLIVVGNQVQLDGMKAELDNLYMMKASWSIPAQYQPGIEPLGCLIKRMPDGQLIMHQRSYIENCNQGFIF